MGRNWKRAQRMVRHRASSLPDACPGRARCHVGESPTGAKRLRLRSKGGGVARKQDGGALRQHTRKEYARSIRLQRAVNADVASSHDQPVAETVDNARRQHGPTKRVRSGGPHRRGISGDMMRTTACQLERPSTPGGRNLAEETLPITASGKWKGRRQGVGSGHTVCLTVDASGGLKSHSARGPGPISEGGGNASPAREDGRYGEANEARRRKPGNR